MIYGDRDLIVSDHVTELIEAVSVLLHVVPTIEQARPIWDLNGRFRETPGPSCVHLNFATKDPRGQKR
jgi:hypothetical protein